MIPLVIFVPGLYSSTLKPRSEASGALSCLRDKWNPPTSLALSLAKGNCGHSGLALPITWTVGESGKYVQDKDDIEATDCLNFVQDKLLKFLDTLNDNNLIELHKIVWDWRRSFEEAEDTVSSKIASICKEDERQAIVLTHSTGAMLTWPTISKHPEWFSDWVNAAGCLLCGSNTFLGDFDHGWNKSFIKMFSKEAFFTWPGLYSYFPLSGELWHGEGDSDYIKRDESFYSWDDIDIFNIATWESLKLGIFSWKKGEVTEEERTHLKHCLTTAKKFRETNILKNGKILDPSFLDRDPSMYGHLKITCYGSSANKCHSAYEVNMLDNTMNVSTSKLMTAGDGTIFTKSWQNVPGGLKREIVEAEEGSDHVSLVNDAKLRNILVNTFFAEDELKKASATSLLK